MLDSNLKQTLIKFWDKAKETFVSKIDIKQSNWNQNDENESDFIVGRTHYEKEYDLEIANVTMQAGHNYEYFDFVEDPVVGNTYTMEVTGSQEGQYDTTEEIIATQDGQNILLLNSNGIRLTLWGDSRPSAMGDHRGDLNGPTGVTAKLIDHKYELHQLNPKFISDTVADWNQNDETEGNYIKNRICYDTTHPEEIVNIFSVSVNSNGSFVGNIPDTEILECDNVVFNNYGYSFDWDTPLIAGQSYEIEYNSVIKTFTTEIDASNCITGNLYDEESGLARIYYAPEETGVTWDGHNGVLFVTRDDALTEFTITRTHIYPTSYFFNLPDEFKPKEGEVYELVAADRVIPIEWKFTEDGSSHKYVSISTMYNGSGAIYKNYYGDIPQYDYFITGGCDPSIYSGHTIDWNVQTYSGDIKQIDGKYFPEGGVGYEEELIDVLGTTLHINSNGSIEEAQMPGDSYYYFNPPFYFNNNQTFIVKIGDDEFEFTTSGCSLSGGGGGWGGSYGGGSIGWTYPYGQSGAPNHEIAYISYGSNPSITAGKTFNFYLKRIHKIDSKYLSVPIANGTGMQSIIENDVSYNKASGYRSHAEGGSTQATNDCSHSEGNGTIASGYYAHAEGGSTKAFGQGSHAEGSVTYAVGSYSHAEGSQTVANGQYSHAEGYYTTACGDYSHAEGYAASPTYYNNVTKVNSTTLSVANQNLTSYSGYLIGYSDKIYKISSVSYISQNSQLTLTSSIPSTDNYTWLYLYKYGSRGRYSHTEGYNTVTSSDYAHAEGYNTKANGQYSHAEGQNSTAGGQSSHAEGYYASASGSYSHSEGNNTTASGSNGSHAEGYTSRATGQSAHAEGYNTLASGIYSHAEGNNTIAGGYSHAEGYSSNAGGLYSHAEGYATYATDYSHSEGYYTNAQGSYSHVSGRFNISDASTNIPDWVSGSEYKIGDYIRYSGYTYRCIEDNTDASWDSTKWISLGTNFYKYAEIIGNGVDSSNRSNARTLDWYGNEILAGTLMVNYNQEVSVVNPTVSTSTVLVAGKPTDLTSGVDYSTLSLPDPAGTGEYYGLFTDNSVSGGDITQVTGFSSVAYWRGDTSIISGKTYEFSIQLGVGVIIQLD